MFGKKNNESKNNKGSRQSRIESEKESRDSKQSRIESDSESRNNHSENCR